MLQMFTPIKKLLFKFLFFLFLFCFSQDGWSQCSNSQTSVEFDALMSLYRFNNIEPNINPIDESSCNPCFMNIVKCNPDRLIEKLDLRGLKLNADIGFFKQLKELKAFGSEMTHLPIEMKELQKLEYLDLSNNQLTSISKQILGNLTNLKELRINNNQLTQIPEEIGASNLVILNLSFNQLSSIPEQIGNLQNLDILAASSNKLKTLPKSIGDLQSLQKLFIDNNQIECLPKEVGNICSIEDISIGQNPITPFWDNFCENPQDICIGDDLAFENFPPDITIECDNLQAPVDVTATSSCNTQSPTATFIEETRDDTDFNCDQEYILTRKYEAQDDCGNTITRNQIITVMDRTTPVFFLQPNDLTIECDRDIQGEFLSWLQANGNAQATDNCSENITWSNDYIEGNFTYECGSTTGFVAVTFTAFDDCGNTTSALATFRVTDNTSPIIDCQENRSIACETYQANNPVFPNISDNCTTEGAFSINYTDDQSGLSDCAGTVIRTWEVKDECGNISTCTQTLTILPPSAVCDDIDIFVGGGGENGAYFISFFPPVTQLGFFSVNGEIVSSNTINNLSPGPYSFVFTSTTNPDIVCERTVVVGSDECQLTTPPTIFGVSPDTTISCEVPLDNFGVYALDACGDTLDVLVLDDPIGLSDPCLTQIQRVYIATDRNGNETTYTQFINQEDITPPTITQLPSDMVTDCTGNDFQEEGVLLTWNETNIAILGLATDNCSEVTVTSDFDFFNLSSNACYRSVTVTYTLSDACGNTTSVIATATIEHTTGPSISVNGDIELTCSEYANFTSSNDAGLTITSACSVAPFTFTYEDDQSNLIDCEGTVIRTWLVTDACGNRGIALQDLTIRPDIVVNYCDSIEIMAFDDSGLGDGQIIINYPIVFDVVQTTPSLLGDGGTVEGQEGLLTKFYQNVPAGTYTFNFINAEDPIKFCSVEVTIASPVCSTDFFNVPNDTIVECDDNYPNLIPSEVYAINSCIDSLNVTIIDSLVEDCGSTYTLYRIWLADYLGNTIQAQQKITVADNEAPVVFAPSDITVTCDDYQNDNIPFLDAFDNCSGINLAFGWGDNTSQLTNCEGLVVREWNVSDECGNIIFFLQNITVIDTPAPCVVNQPIAPIIGNVPLDITISCEQEIPSTSNVYALNQCNDTIPVTFTDDVIGLSDDCDTEILRSFYAEDADGNTSTASIVIYIEDKTQPVLGGIPLDITLQCEDNIPAPAIAFATDNCTTNVTIEFEESRTNTDCPDSYTLTRTWQATDDCGNVDVKTQTISIIDQTPPSFLALPADVTINAVLGEDLMEIPTPTAIDNCAESVDLIYTDENYESLNCDEQFTRTWLAFDNCGNVTEVSHRVTIINGTDIVPYTGPDQTIPKGTSTQLEAAGGLNIFWSPEDKLIDPFVANPQTVALDTTTQFCATIFNDDACATIVCMTVFVEEEEAPPLDCNIVNVVGGEEQIDINNILAFYTKIELVGANTNWEVVTVCDGNCETTEIISDLVAGDYILKIQQAQNEEYCYIEVPVTVTSQNTPITPNSANCEAVDLTIENGQLTIYNLSTNYQKVELIGANTNWTPVIICEGDCAETLVVPNLGAGDYTVKISLAGLDGSFCYKEETITISGTNPPLPPSFVNCDAVDLTVENGQLTIYNLSANYQKVELIGANTNWELMTICDGNCEETQVVPNLSAGDYTVKISLAGVDDSFCYKEEIITISGTNPPPPTNLPNCDIVDIFGDIGTITIYNLTAATNKVSYIGSGTNWQVLTVCDGNCNATQTINNLPDGSYSVKIEQVGTDGAYCFKEIEVSVSSTGAVTICEGLGGDTDGDGICDAEDNCPTISNTDQADNDDDGIGNLCDDTPDGATNPNLTTINCGAITIQYGDGQISYAYSGNGSITYKLADETRSIYFIEDCSNGCAASATFENLPNGVYNFQIWADWNATCSDYPPNGFTIVLTDDDASSRNTLDVGPKLGVYPNPAQEEVFLNLQHVQEEKVQIELYNYFSQRVYQKQLAQVNAQTERVDLANYDNGLYFMKIKVGQHRMVTKKLMIARMY